MMKRPKDQLNQYLIISVTQTGSDRGAHFIVMRDATKIQESIAHRCELISI